MISEPIGVQVLKGKNAIEKYAIQLRADITKAGGGSKVPVSWQEVRNTIQTNIDDLIKSNPLFVEASQQSTINSNLQRFLSILDDGIKKGDFKLNNWTEINMVSISDFKKYALPKANHKLFPFKKKPVVN